MVALSSLLYKENQRMIDCYERRWTELLARTILFLPPPLPLFLLLTLSVEPRPTISSREEKSTKLDGGEVADPVPAALPTIRKLSFGELAAAMLANDPARGRDALRVAV